MNLCLSVGELRVSTERYWLFLSLYLFLLLISAFSPCLLLVLSGICTSVDFFFLALLTSLSLSRMSSRIFGILIWWPQTSEGALCHGKTLFLQCRMYQLRMQVFETLHPRLFWTLRFVLSVCYRETNLGPLLSLSWKLSFLNKYILFFKKRETTIVLMTLFFVKDLLFFCNSC